MYLFIWIFRQSFTAVPAEIIQIHTREYHNHHILMGKSIFWTHSKLSLSRVFYTHVRGTERNNLAVFHISALKWIISPLQIRCIWCIVQKNCAIRVGTGQYLWFEQSPSLMLISVIWAETNKIYCREATFMLAIYINYIPKDRARRSLRRPTSNSSRNHSNPCTIIQLRLYVFV